VGVPPSDVGIVGAGTAGMAAALFLSRAGHHVTLYERVPDPSPIGAGIILQPTGQFVLSRLGLLEEVMARGARIDRLLCETSTRRPVVDLHYGTVGEGLCGLGMHRGVIFEHLFDAVRRERITVRLGAPVDAFERAESGWRVRSADGSTLGTHAFVIAADGARSRLRETGVLPSRTRRYRWGAMWFVARDTERRYRRSLWQIVDRNHTMLGLLPTGLGPGSATSEPHVSIYWSIREDRVEALQRTGFDAWKSRVRSLAPGCDSVLAQIDSPDQLLFTAYHDVRMPRWHGDGVVFIGDAAHAMSPQLGQGCNLALCDAMVLADSLAATSDLATALDRYARERTMHLRFYQFATRWLTPFFQSDVTLLGVARDLFFPIGARLAWFRRMMTESMVGIRRGFFARSLDWVEARALLPPEIAGAA
jgi:2-polyprenyl-6-methoxyphenol hydroxylase-like FAD-dependent oxidoreductase